MADRRRRAGTVRDRRPRRRPAGAGAGGQPQAARRRGPQRGTPGSAGPRRPIAGGRPRRPGEAAQRTEGRRSSCSSTASPTREPRGDPALGGRRRRNRRRPPPPPGRPHHADGRQGRRRRHRARPHRRRVGLPTAIERLRKAGIWVVGLDDGARRQPVRPRRPRHRADRRRTRRRGFGPLPSGQGALRPADPYPHARSPVVAQRERGGRARLLRDHTAPSLTPAYPDRRWPTATSGRRWRWALSPSATASCSART